MKIELFDPIIWAITILICATLFTVIWGLDALTHRELVKKDITDPELNTHRNILAGSMIMELSLVTMYWYPLISLPFFIAGFIVRTAHEFIDELKFHVDRCSVRENYIHLGMWFTLISKTFLQFIWGFFYSYKGFEELNPLIYLWGILIIISMSLTAYFEWWRSSQIKM